MKDKEKKGKNSQTKPQPDKPEKSQHDKEHAEVDKGKGEGGTPTITQPKASASAISQQNSQALASLMVSMREENDRMMRKAMDSFEEKMLKSRQKKNMPGTSAYETEDGELVNENSPSTHPQEGRRSKFAYRSVTYRDEYEDESDQLDVHASEFGEDLISLDKAPPSVARAREGSPGSSGSQSNSVITLESGDKAKQILWQSVMHQLPSYYEDNLGCGTESGDNVHKSFMAESFARTKKNACPQLPLDGLLKEKWDTVEGYMKKGNVSPYTSVNSRKFRVQDADFERYGKVPRVEQAYKAMSESRPRHRSEGHTDPIIRDKNLRIAECDLQKCDDSARVILRASSHGSLLLNAVNTVLSKKDFQPEEAINLVHAAFQSVEAIADSALRITARSISARRRIYLSQVNFKDSNAHRELMTLPMDGKYLFHGEFSEVMHKYASLARDVRETSDYASVQSTRKRGLESSNTGPPFKRPADPPRRRPENSGNRQFQNNRRGQQTRRGSFQNRGVRSPFTIPKSPFNPSKSGTRGAKQ